MSAETILTAARRVVRFYRIDEAHGGLSSIDTAKAIETLDKMVRREDARQKAEEDWSGGKALPDRGDG